MPKKNEKPLTQDEIDIAELEIMAYGKTTNKKYAKAYRVALQKEKQALESANAKKIRESYESDLQKAWRIGESYTAEQLGFSNSYQKLQYLRKYSPDLRRVHLGDIEDTRFIYTRVFNRKSFSPIGFVINFAEHFEIMLPFYIKYLVRFFFLIDLEIWFNKQCGIYEEIEPLFHGDAYYNPKMSIPRTFEKHSYAVVQFWANRLRDLTQRAYYDHRQETSQIREKRRKKVYQRNFSKRLKKMKEKEEIAYQEASKIIFKSADQYLRFMIYIAGRKNYYRLFKNGPDRPKKDSPKIRFKIQYFNFILKNISLFVTCGVAGTLDLCYHHNFFELALSFGYDG